jgi:hypothetical protein
VSQGATHTLLKGLDGERGPMAKKKNPGFRYQKKKGQRPKKSQKARIRTIRAERAVGGKKTAVFGKLIVRTE